MKTVTARRRRRRRMRRPRRFEMRRNGVTKTSWEEQGEEDELGEENPKKP